MYNVTNSTDIAEIMINVSSNVPVLFPMLLLFEFCVIAFGGIYANQRRVGYSNMSMWFSIAGLVTTTSAFVLFLVDGLINLPTLSIVCALTFSFVLWFLMTEDDA